MPGINKELTEARCKNCRFAIKMGNKLYCSKKGMKQTFPFNSCLKFERLDNSSLK